MFAFTLVAVIAAAPQEAVVVADAMPALVKSKPLAADKADDELRKLVKERYNAALEETRLGYQLIKPGKWDLQAKFEAPGRLHKAANEVYENPADKIAFLKDLVALRKYVETGFEERNSAGTIPKMDLLEAKFARPTAEIELLKLQRAAK